VSNDIIGCHKSADAPNLAQRRDFIGLAEGFSIIAMRAHRPDPAVPAGLRGMLPFA
jgi:hypothetical protein